jgi:D-arginine dehydrogenase
VPSRSADVVVIGGGMAGVTVAAALAPECRVLLVEAEPELARHATGRSAAAFLETYGPAPVRQLTRASRPLLDAASRSAGTPPILTPRPLLWLARPDQRAHLEAALAEQPTLEALDVAAVEELVPCVRPGHIGGGALERNAADIDVAALHQHHVRALRAAGGEVALHAPLVAGRRHGGRWELQLGGASARLVGADVVVDAAGAWADEVATRLGARPVGLVPKRRTVAIARSDVPVDPAWPLVADVGDRFYFKPEGPHVLVSPADETPAPPGDARPEELDVARALERARAATTLGLRSVVRAWAGLRTFAPDGLPVVGADDEAAGLVWLAGQGGYGIQLAAALALVAAASVTGSAPAVSLADLDVDALGPRRARGH